MEVTAMLLLRPETQAALPPDTASADLLLFLQPILIGSVSSIGKTIGCCFGFDFFSAYEKLIVIDEICVTENDRT